MSASETEGKPVSWQHPNQPDVHESEANQMGYRDLDTTSEEEGRERQDPWACPYPSNV